VGVITQADVIAYVLADLVLILVAARIMGRVAAMLGQPRVAGEITAGILIGPTLLGGQVRAMGGVVVDVVTRLALVAALVLVLLAVVRPVLGWGFRRVDETRHAGSILAGLLILALTSGLVSDRIGISALIGGFLVGLAVPVTPTLVDMIVTRLHEVVVLLFLPVFFAVSGWTV